jgi:hypothetical protein
MIYLSGCIVKERHERLGFMITPDMGNRIPDDAMIAADNACFNNPEAYSNERYERLLHKMPRGRTLFATAPDVLGSHSATVERSGPMLRRIRFLGLPSAFVAQDGWEEETTPWDELDVLFIGGTTGFKFRGGREACYAAKRKKKRCHMGRVNSFERLRAAAAIGCDSADGTYLKFGPDVNWPKLKRWLDHLTERPGLAV